MCISGEATMVKSNDGQDGGLQIPPRPDADPRLPTPTPVSRRSPWLSWDFRCSPW